MTNQIKLLSKELAVHSCPKSKGWKPRGGCARVCDQKHSEKFASNCWAQWANEKQEPNDK